MPQTLLLADDSVTIQRVIELTFADEDIHGRRRQRRRAGDRAHRRGAARHRAGRHRHAGRSGYEVAQHIKQSPRLQHIPVLLLTGAFEPVDEAKAAAAGCDGVLAKPFEPQLVIARVKELLGQRRAKRAAPAAPAAESTEPPTLRRRRQSGEPRGPSRHRADGAICARPSQVAHLDDYFDQLDAAFADARAARRRPNGRSAGPASPVADIIDWFGGNARASGPAGPAAVDDLAGAEPTSQTPDTRAGDRAADLIGAAPSRSLRSSRVRVRASRAAGVARPDLPSQPNRRACSPSAERVRAAELASSRQSRRRASRIAPEPSSRSPAPESAPKPSRSCAAAAPHRRAASPPASCRRSPTPLPRSSPPSSTNRCRRSRTAGRRRRRRAVERRRCARARMSSKRSRRRVLDRLSDRVVRETVADLVSSIAERLVREEIERIKASIK